MANDDFGNFPKPPSSTNNQDPLGSSTSPNLPPETPPAPITPPEPEFEETPDELPTFSSSTDNSTTPTVPSNPFNDFKDKDVDPLPQTPVTPPTPITPPEPTFTPKTDPQPQPASIPSNLPKTPTSSLLTIILLLLAGVGISASMFMYSQSSVLKKQLADITKTLEQQKTIITPTPTPTIIDIPSPTPTASPTATITISPSATPSATPTASSSAGKVIPFSLAPQALKIGLNHEPNAQLLLVKIESAQDTNSYLIKYFFRKDLTTKKYFYVTIDSKNESEIKSSAVYVNPDNNIPSLNDQVLGNKLGIDFPDAYKIVTDLCTKDYTNLTCKELPTSAQFIQAGDTNIWQITLTSGNDKFVYQINSKTKEVLFKPNK